MQPQGQRRGLATRRNRTPPIGAWRRPDGAPTIAPARRSALRRGGPPAPTGALTRPAAGWQTPILVGAAPVPTGVEGARESAGG